MHLRAKFLIKNLLVMDRQGTGKFEHIKLTLQNLKATFVLEKWKLDRCLPL